MTDHLTPTDDIKRVIIAIADAQNRIDQGEKVDLGDLVQRIETVCERLAAMPGEQSRPHAQSLALILRNLDGLEKGLKVTLVDLNQRLTILSQNEESTKS